MNKKQKIVLWTSIGIVAPFFIGRFFAAVQFGSWDVFFNKTFFNMLSLMFFLGIVVGGLIFALKDKKLHNDK